ncbi:tetratricopeptide repeat protein [Bradyrhizobium ontarionense]|uniref:Tetratricopeptide repeat protein n=1 Tax=Bradyrhizobium ontarionense TaxID=2898149 RepID=A0ABY3R9I8_9BRAD|nr:tetratricopeptide repeat protein [Bradyrhizobium sp. A19]UFZ03408.1 tetratricopeptide repeat protein [Bradyrhizobium sp. A19]
MSERRKNSQAQALQEAVHALRARQFARAEQIAASILRANRTDRPALLVLAHALLGQQRASEAIAPLEKAALRGSDPEIETLLGAALCDARRAVDGLAQLRRTAARRPPYLPSFQELAGRLAKAGQLGEAIGVIEEALALMPDSVDLKLDLARLSLQANDRARARANLLAARDAAPGRPDILIELAWVLFLDGDYAEAAGTYRHALGLRPDDTQTRANLAMCLLEMGDRDGAQAALRTVLRGRPHLLTRAAYTLAVSSHGRFFFRPSAAAKFLQADGAGAAKP